jgi:phosphatidylserine decarboxylase
MSDSQYIPLAKVNGYLFLMKVFSGNCLSLLVGRAARLKLPAFVLVPILNWYSGRYGVNPDEVPVPLCEYSCLGDFLSRSIDPEKRPIGPGLVSPVDARLVEYGEVQEGRIHQIKDWSYSAAELLNEKQESRYRSGSFATLYLAPGDYHHIHAPCDGVITEMRYVPGALWPVNSWSVSNVPNLFCRNERVVIFLETDTACLALVLVGATNVGSITLSFDELRTNSGAGLFKRQTSVVKSYSEPVAVVRGRKIASFNLGSTVVMCCESADLLREIGVAKGSKVKYGETLSVKESF